MTDKRKVLLDRLIQDNELWARPTNRQIRLALTQ